MSGTAAVGYFLFSVCFSFIVFILWTRFALVFFKVSPFFSLSQTIFRLTNPMISPIYLGLSFFIRRKSRYDIHTLIGIFILELIKYLLVGLLFMQTILPMTLILSLSLISMIIEPCNLLFYAIMGRVILSWVSPSTHHPLIEIIYAVTEPILYPIRKRLPTTAGLDFSPLVAIVLLKSITLFLTTAFPLAT